MNNRKNQNSLLVLATLGVYLGLVLAGATPQVLAQAALAKQFNVKDEIEVKDDLDKKPKDCADDAPEQINQLIGFNIISDGIISFAEDLDKITRIGKYTKGEPFEFSFQRKHFQNGIGQLDSSSHSYNRWAHLAATENVDKVLELICPWAECGDFFRYDKELKTNVSVEDVSFVLNNEGLVTKISLEKKSNAEAETFAKLYQTVFEIGGCSDYTPARQRLIYRNTTATSLNNQVFIVTRLPRAGLDSLLATDAK